MNPLVARLIPRAAQLGPAARRLLCAGFGLLVLILAVTAANAVFGLGGDTAERPIRDWLSSAVYILVAAIVTIRAAAVPAKRAPWVIFAAGVCAYGIGNVVWSAWVEHLRSVPIPSVCDGFWLSFYPLSYIGIVGFARGRGQRRVAAGVWLDGLIAGAGMAAIGAALVFHPVLQSATGGTVAVSTELAYPIGDLLLAALVVGLLALRGWRLERAWTFLGGGFVLMALADCMYALQVAGGASTPTAMTNLIYVVSVAMLALAAWQPEPVEQPARVDSRSVLLLPAGFTLAALALFQYDHVHPLDPLAFGLADVTLTAAVARTILTIREIRGLAEARRQASTDDLTALPNRRTFMRRAARAVADAHRRGRGVTVMMMDLDNFKELNDTLGHHAGDVLLTLIGPRIQRTLGAGDLVARLGGDEFGILLERDPDPARLARTAQRILDGLDEPFTVQGLALRLTASLGIASYPADGADEAELISRADFAMYQAKSQRRGYEFYARERDTSSPQRLAVAADLADALQTGDIVVHFQPKADAASREILGLEALVRWRHRDGRLIPPDEFVRAAEHAGLSRILTRRVMELALHQVSVWRRRWPDLQVAVNTTVADLLDLEFPREVAAALHEHGLPPEALVLEVTETSIMSDPARIGIVLAQLGELGIRLSLDDFGTGYSSLAHLRSLPVGEVKIDRSFVQQMATETTDAAIVGAIAQLARRLGMSVVAEGVEDEATWLALHDLGCDVIQGYALSRPRPAEELEDLLVRSASAAPVPAATPAPRPAPQRSFGALSAGRPASA